jgi:hypothetical protein
VRLALLLFPDVDDVAIQRTLTLTPQVAELLEALIVCAIQIVPGNDVDDRLDQ